jgi:hypothetical protein
LEFITTFDDQATNESRIYLKAILADFSASQRKGFLSAITQMYGEHAGIVIEKKLAGCLVHFARGNLRAITSRNMTDDDKGILLKFLKKVESAATKQDVIDRLNALKVVDSTLTNYIDWWCQDYVVNMLFNAVVLKRNGQRSDTNIQEILHNNVGAYGNFLLEFEHNIKEAVLATYRVLCMYIFHIFIQLT